MANKQGRFFVAIVMLAVISGSIRLAIHHIDNFRAEIEYLLRQELSSSIAFSELFGDMNGLNPVIGIENISLTLPDRSQPLFIDRLTFEIDFWGSLVGWQPVVREIAGDLEKLEMTRNPAGRWLINDVDLGGDGQYAAPALSSLMQALPRYVKINLNRLVVRDQRDDLLYQLTGVDAHLNRGANTTLIQFSAGLPDELGSTFTLKSVVRGQSMVVYVDSPELRLAPIARLLDLDTRGLRQATLAGEFWINLADNRLQSVNGRFDLDDGILQTSPTRKPLQLTQRAQFSSLRTARGWRVNGRIERIGIDGRDLPPFEAQVELGNRQGSDTLDAWVERLQVSGLPALAGQWLPQPLAKQIEKGDLSGDLANLFLSLKVDRPEEFLFAGDARRLSSRRLGALPGIRNLDAEIYGSNRRVGAHLSGRELELDFGDEFIEPLRFDTVVAEAALEFEAGRALIAVERIEAANADVSATGRLWLETDAQAAPFMYLRGEFGDGDAASTSKYLPRNLTPPQTLAWLDRGIVAGNIPGGAMQYHGRLRDVRDLARDFSGELYVGFSVEDAEVDFAPGWAPVTSGAGRVLFHNTSMVIDLDRGNYRDIAATRVKATIADFENPVLELDIEADTSVKAALAAWVLMPVGRDYADLVARVDRSAGEVAARVDVQLPLGDGDPRAQVLLDLKSAALEVSQWGLDLSQLDGRLRVTGAAITADRLEGRFFDDPVEIEIVRQPAATQVLASGNFESKNLFTRFPQALRDRVVGHSDWRIQLNLPDKKTNRRQPDWRLALSSGLERTALELPAPIAMPAGEAQRISVDLAGYPGYLDFGAMLGDRIHLQGQMRPEGDDFRIAYLDVGLNELPRPQPSPGIVLHGQAADLDLGAWLAVFADSGSGHPAAMSGLDLRFDRVHLNARRFDDVRVEVAATGDVYTGFIDSKQLSGSLQLPRRPTPDNPMKIDLERLVIDKLEQDSDYSELRPASFADLELRCKTLTYHDMEFNDLELVTRANGDVLEVDRLNFRRDEVRLTGSAQWRYDALSNAHLSSTSVSIRGPKVGEAIDGLGFGNSIRGGTVDFRGGFTWPAPLFDPDLVSVVGDAQVRLENGVLNNVEPGTGRFVGLLSLSALPRRLSLDFSDVLIDGMEFDTITGSYRMENGVLNTDDTRMDGPAARIKITGNTGIVERNYDQRIRVTPKIRQTLPVIGAISAGSTVGWGLLLLQNLFKKSIDKAVEVEYEITGSWENPEVKLVRAVDENQQEVPPIER